MVRSQQISIRYVGRVKSWEKGSKMKNVTAWLESPISEQQSTDRSVFSCPIPFYLSNEPLYRRVIPMWNDRAAASNNEEPFVDRRSSILSPLLDIVSIGPPYRTRKKKKKREKIFRKSSISFLFDIQPDKPYSLLYSPFAFARASSSSIQFLCT